RLAVLYSASAHHRHHPSFPTRRSSDLLGAGLSHLRSYKLQYKYTVLTNTTIGAFMSQLDGNIVLIALPTITRSLNASAFEALWVDRKSTRLNSSHVSISYAVFCLTKKN